MMGRSAMANASFAAAAQIVGKLTTLAWTLVAAQQLGQEGFGAFNLILALNLVIAALGEWGFDSVLVQRGSVDRGALSRYFTESAVWQVGLATPMLLLGGLIFSATRSEQEAVLAFFLVVVAILCDTVSDTARTASTVIHRQGRTSAALTMQRTLTAIVAIPALMAKPDLVMLAAAFSGTSVVGLLLHLRALRRLDLRLDLRLLTWHSLRAYGRGTTRIGLSALLSVVLYRAGFILLGALSGDAEVGAYSAAYRLFDTVLFLTFALVSAVFPLMSATRDKDRSRRLTEVATGILIVMYLPFAVVCLMEAPRLVELLFGHEYVAATSQPLRWLAIGPLLFAVAFVGGTVLIAVEQTQGLLIAAISATATNIILNVGVIPSMGASGAAIGLLVALSVDAVVTTCYVRRALGRWPRLLDQVYLPAVACIAVAGVIWTIRAAFLLELAIAAFVYVACWFGLALWRDHQTLELVGEVPLVRTLVAWRVELATRERRTAGRRAKSEAPAAGRDVAPRARATDSRGAE